MDRTAVLNFDIPDWGDLGLAADLAQRKNWLLKTATQEQFKLVAPVLQRLVTDSRMKRVFTELDRRSRSSADRPQLHGATVSPEMLAVLGFDGSDPVHHRSTAKRVLFDVLFALSTLPIRVIERGRIKPRGLLDFREVKHLSEIEINAADLSAGGGEDHPAVREWLRHRSLGLWHVVLCVDEIGLVVNPKVATQNLRARCVGIGVASMCRELFGSHLYKTTATLTSMAIGERIELTQVREWCSQIAAESDSQRMPDRKHQRVA